MVAKHTDQSNWQDRQKTRSEIRELSLKSLNEYLTESKKQYDLLVKMAVPLGK